MEDITPEAAVTEGEAAAAPEEWTAEEALVVELAEDDKT